MGERGKRKTRKRSLTATRKEGERKRGQQGTYLKSRRKKGKRKGRGEVIWGGGKGGRVVKSFPFYCHGGGRKGQRLMFALGRGP